MMKAETKSSIAGLEDKVKEIIQEVDQKTVRWNTGGSPVPAEVIS